MRLDSRDNQVTNSLVHLQHRNVIQTFAVKGTGCDVIIDLVLCVKDLVKAQICAQKQKKKCQNVDAHSLELH